jgi:hypothetical protein
MKAAITEHFGKPDHTMSREQVQEAVARFAGRLKRQVARSGAIADLTDYTSKWNSSDSSTEEGHLGGSQVLESALVRRGSA